VRAKVIFCLLLSFSVLSNSSNTVASSEEFADLTAPVVDQIVAPANADGGSTITVTWRTSDDIGLGGNQSNWYTGVLLNSSSGWIMSATGQKTQTSGDSRNATFSQIVIIPSGASGAHTLQFFATDGAGRTTNIYRDLNVQVRPISTGLTPLFSSVTRTADGFTFQISNFDRNYTWTSSSNAFISATGFVTVSGLQAGQSGTATIYTARNGYTSASAVITNSAKPISTGWISLKLNDLVSNGVIGEAGLQICDKFYSPGVLPPEEIINCDNSFSLDVGQLVSSSNGLVLRTISLCGVTFGPGVRLGTGVFVRCTSPQDKADAEQAEAERISAAKAEVERLAAEKANSQPADQVDANQEAPITGEISAKVSKNKFVLNVSTNLPSAEVVIFATKKGSKSVRIDLVTNTKGEKSVTSKLNLKGYTLTLRSGKDVLDKFVLK
jgi:hypothetical protein